MVVMVANKLICGASNTSNGASSCASCATGTISGGANVQLMPAEVVLIMQAVVM